MKNWRIRVLRIPFLAPVRWAAHSENGADVVLLEIEESNGLRGVAEMAVRPKWHGETLRQVVDALHRALLPALRNIDLSSDVFEATLESATQSPLARALADMARADVMAQCHSLALPEWLALAFTHENRGEAKFGEAAFSCTITRAAPGAMAAEAAQLMSSVDARAFKIKTGQGVATDSAALAGIRAAAPVAYLSADSNSAGLPDIVAEMSAMLARHGVAWFEDPCRLHADESFRQVRAASSIPVLVDNACRSRQAAASFLDLGAAGLSVKIMKTGIVESIAIANLAAERGAKVTIGICASTSLSAIYSLSLFAALPPELRAMPCEETFFLNLPRDLLASPLAFRQGVIDLPPAGPLADLLDWKAINELRTGAIMQS